MELVEAARTLDRFCTDRTDCKGCPLNFDDCDCGGVLVAHTEKSEEVLTEWLKDNPAPVRLTWKEWLDTFPTSDPSSFCPLSFTVCGCREDIDCDSCRNEVIPEYIAGKLNIPFKEV